MKELYQVLGVERSASADEIKKAYRKRTRENHPDRHPGDKAAEERFKQANAAYEVLGDEKKRKLYDEFGEMSLTQNFDPSRARAYNRAQRQRAATPGFSPDDLGPMFDDVSQAQHTSFDDLLSRLFGGGRVASGGRRQGRGANIEGDVKVSLMDSLHGVTVPLRVEGADGEARTLDVKVPKGVSDGGKLRLRGQGGEGKPRGDIVLTIRVTPGRRMTRRGNDLKLTVPVTAFEALRGGPVDIPTPWGPVTVKLPRGSQNGQTLRLRGKGVQPKGKNPGDLLVTLEVKLPDDPSDALLAALEEAQGTEHVRAGLVL
ncbi:MAG: DnaJ C-terminal domain-containing protein [Myxococcota bacterium]